MAMRNRDKILLGALAGAGVLWGARAWRRHQRRIDLAGRVVIITGASSGHGFLVARRAAERGAHLVLAARNLDALRSAEAELLRDGAASVLAVATDVLINNAGIISVGPVEAMTLDDFRAAMATNFWGALYATMAVLPHMRARQFGRIANVSSLGGKAAMPHLLPYTASKFALTGLTEGLRPELARDHIYVTGVYPSTMRTGGHTHAWFKGNREGEYTWFALSDTLPVVSASADRVARRLLGAVCHGEAEVIIGWPAHLAAIVQGLFPNEMAEMMAVVNRLLPRPSDPEDHVAIQGEKLAGTVPEMLSRMIPPSARPTWGNGRSH